jgi:hypothetical protein
MIQFAKQRGYLEATSGSHLCVLVGANNREVESGYIHISGDRFYRMHPTPDLFLKNFKKFNNYYIST